MYVRIMWLACVVCGYICIDMYIMFDSVSIHLSLSASSWREALGRRSICKSTHRSTDWYRRFEKAFSLSAAYTLNTYLDLGNFCLFFISLEAAFVERRSNCSLEAGTKTFGCGFHTRRFASYVFTHMCRLRDFVTLLRLAGMFVFAELRKTCVIFEGRQLYSARLDHVLYRPVVFVFRSARKGRKNFRVSWVFSVNGCAWKSHQTRLTQPTYCSAHLTKLRLFPTSANPVGSLWRLLAKLNVIFDVPFTPKFAVKTSTGLFEHGIKRVRHSTRLISSHIRSVYFSSICCVTHKFQIYL